MKRRGLIAGAVAVVAGAATGAWTKVAKASARLRPPGAKPGREFDAACIRCFRCAEVCPPKAIRFESNLFPGASDLPFIDAREQACVVCMKCTQACPTGALARVPADLPTVQKLVKMGTPVLDRRSCIPWRGEGVCRLCYYACPYPDTAVALVGAQQAPVFEAKSCIGCGLCEEACPRLAHAIRIVPIEESR
ncbi:MAG: 4Fe-4S dicluster domain-containing protein [Myxococcaceae bacterium]